MLGSVYPDWEKKVALFQSSREFGAKLSRMDAETEKIRADTEKVKAETSQTDTDNDIKRRRERWKKWFVRGIAVLLLLVTFTLIALTITGKIDWSAVVRYLISCTLVLLRLFIKAKLEKE